MIIWVRLVILCLAAVISTYCGHELYQIHRLQKNETISRIIYLPTNTLRTISLEFRGIVSDYLMLKTMTFMGEKIEKQEALTPENWQMVYEALNQITNLDPRFLDPYVVAQMSLPWDAGMVTETNKLLEKGAKVRTNDYRPYYFLWFNHFWFLKDPRTAAGYLAKAAQLPGAPDYYVTLAARMNLYGGTTEAGILFLQEMLQDITDPVRKKYTEMRLETLKRIFFLEQKVLQYKNKFHAYPKTLDELITKGILLKIPNDPYGGKFYIMDNGRIYTTSKLVPVQN